MSNYLYEVKILRGMRHPEFATFKENVDRFNPKIPDFGGLNNLCVISHHVDKLTVHLLCTENMKNRDDVEVNEITEESLNDEESGHKIYLDLIENYFLPYGTYPNLWD